MKDIFTDLYNKVLGFFRQTEKKEDESTKDVACNRLKFVLMQDRTNLTPELMDRMRKELIELLSKYVEMDKDALELGFEQEGSQMALMLSIPVVRAKDEAEIEEILAKEDEEKAKLEEASSDQEDNTSEEDMFDNEDNASEKVTDSKSDKITSEEEEEEEAFEAINNEELTNVDNKTVISDIEKETSEKVKSSVK